MFLKSLELVGFKSFASKVILEFPAGITAIVGPNGAGKSNLIDAVRWLLGERETKNLRSAKAEDLIFNGTPKKPKMNLAQAGLSFNNDSGFFPADFKEVSVVRRVTRDGISRYFLNKAEVRLKDIIDFFSRARLGTKGLIIVNQGDSDVFVKASPEERRIMIEEILGLREYQIKKNEAQRKLRQSSFNLEKAKAMVSEVVPRLRMLKRQTNKWTKRLDIQKELTELENNYFSYKLKEIGAVRLKINPALKLLEGRISDEEKEIKVFESKIKKIESQPQEEYQKIKKIKNQQNKLLAEHSLIQKELGRLEAKLEILAANNNIDADNLKNSDLFNLVHKTKQDIEKCLNYSDIKELKDALSGIIKGIIDFLQPSKIENPKLKEMKDLKNAKSDLSKKVETLERELGELENQEAEITARLEEFNKSFHKIFESAEIKRKELRYLEEEKNKILFEKEKSNLKFQDLENQLRQIGKRLEDFQSIEAQLPYTENELHEIEKRILRLRAELSAIGEIDESLLKEAQEVESHYNFLTSQSKDLEKAIADLKNLINELNNKIHFEFNNSLRLINEEFNRFFRLMFGGGQAKLKIKNYEAKIKNNNKDGNENDENNKNLGIEKDEEGEIKTGIEIDLNLPKRKISSLEMLSGGERSLVSVAALFALILISPPPFLVLDEIDAALDENNSKRFANFIKEFSKKTQFVIVTHNRAVMEVADVLYGITTGEEGTSKVLSLKLEC